MKQKIYFFKEQDLTQLISGFAPYDSMFNEKRNFNITKKNAKSYWKEYKELNGME